MTDVPAEIPRAQTAQRAHRKPASIIPDQSMAGQALVLVIAIMTFLSCLTLGAVTMIRDTAADWQTQISREATIQIKPAEGLDMDAALVKAADIASGFPGVTGVRIVDQKATARLLEPWLGSNIDFNQLPIPRLVIITIDQASPPDFTAMRTWLAPELPTATLDDHRTWVDRLIAMARTMVTIGMSVLALMLTATVLTVIFATRGAMAGAGHIIDVLHFVGAEARFIAVQFRRHFLLTGAKGAVAGGIAAVFTFIAFSWWSSMNMATPEADQATALFGNFSIGVSGYAGVAFVMLAVAGITALTSHLTVIAYLTDIEARQHDAS
ncbi:cell division protein FtsX [Arvimicrobium flavum]|uniref:cell division protein FtsX n=1 Tax=Arvimicrobium flavum TaxID=3393320 RepID=UPI00237A7345|nr:ABC transporter permease [Mesorhizobium shangrilense]